MVSAGDRRRAVIDEPAAEKAERRRDGDDGERDDEPRAVAVPVDEVHDQQPDEIDAEVPQHERGVLPRDPSAENTKRPVSAVV